MRYLLLFTVLSLPVWKANAQEEPKKETTVGIQKNGRQ